MLVGIGVALIIGIFLLDLQLPLGVADGMLYIAPVAIGLWIPGRKYTLASGVSSAGLTVAGFFLSPPGGEIWKAVVNRGMSVGVIGVTAIVCLLQKRTQESLNQKNAFVQLLQAVAVAANEARNIRDAAQVCLDKVCEVTGWPVGHAYFLDEGSGKDLIPSDIWRLDEPRQFETFVKVTEGTRLPSGVGLPGRVLESGKPSWIVDVTRDPNFPRAKQARDIGVKGGFAFPALVDREVVGVLEFFSAKAETPNEALLDIMAHVGAQLGRAVERDRTEKVQRAARENLERGIRERTAELSNANRELQTRIREHQEAEAALDRLNRQYDLILTSAAEGIFGLDLQGRFIFVNPAAAHSFAYGIEELIGQPVEIVLKPPKIQADSMSQQKESLVYVPLRECISCRATDEVFWRRDGTSFPVEYIGTSSLENGRVVGAVVTFKNIAERKHFERQTEALLHSLERANNELKEFSYIVSHDLKEPVRGIASLGQWIAEDYAKFFDDAGRQQMQLLLDNAKRMHKLIDGILSYSHIGRENLDRVELDVAEVLKAVIGSLFVPDAIKVRARGPFPAVLFHQIHLEQIFQNLIGNAIKHIGKPEGEIVVSCRDAGEVWEFCVQDNGVGIEERHFDRIFKIFQTLKRKDENYADSTGIGLALVKKIVDIHGEEIWLESAVGKGTSFYFTITKTFQKDKVSHETK